MKWNIAKDATIDLPLKQFPGDHFSPVQLRNFESNSIVTAEDFINADPELVGRILGHSPRQAKMAQSDLHKALSERR